MLLRGVHKGAQLKVVINPIYIFDAISIKIPVKFQNSIFFSFTEIDNPEMFIEKWKFPNSQNNFKKKFGGTTLSDFRLYYKDIVIKTIWS